MSKINVRGIEPNTDPSYRYKMHQLIIQKQGTNTILSNLDQVAKDINREPSHIVKYIEATRGCKISLKKGKYQLSAKVSEDEVCKTLYEFIEYLVLCPGCRNPETSLSREGEKVVLTCASGGEVLSPLSDIPFSNKKGMEKVLKLIK